MHLLFTPLAVQDFEHIGDFIARDNSTRAVSFVAEIEAQCQKICINPEGYQKRPELSTDLPSCAHGNYIIFFESNAEAVTIIRILQGARDLQRLLNPSLSSPKD
jgi:toxin ParE1/3/4